MGLGAVPLETTRRYVERVRQLLRGETVEWDFEGKQRAIRFLNPDLGLINLEEEIPLWFSAFGPKAKRVAAELGAGWLNFGIQGAAESLAETRQIWEAAGHEAKDLHSNLFVLGAVLDGDETQNEARLMAEAAPLTAVMFHNLADEVGAMGGRNLPRGPLAEALDQYLAVHDGYRPEGARYLLNHRGHLMFVRPEETHLTPELVRATTLSGTTDELVKRLRGLKAAGYEEVTVQLVHGHEASIEDWARVFKAV